MTVSFEEYQIFYEIFLDTFISRNEGTLKTSNGNKFSPTIWEYNEDKVTEIFKGGRIESSMYFYRLYDKYKPEKAGIGEINDFALSRVLDYIEIPQAVDSKQKLSSSEKLQGRFNHLLEKYSYLKLQGSIDQNISTSIDAKFQSKNYLVDADNKYLLSVIEVIELFCQSIDKYNQEINPESKSINNSFFTPTPEQLNNFLLNCTEEYSSLFSQKIDVKNNPFLLYELKLSVQKGVPLFVLENELAKMVVFLGLSMNKYKPIKSIKITERFLDFESSCWSFFYFIFYKYGNVIKPCLGQAIIEFGSYGAVKFKSINQVYTGRYQTYGENEYYLQMSLKLARSFQRDMRILVYCGSAVTPEIMLGQYSNLELTITAGNIVMERIQGEYDKLTPKHIYQDDPEYLNVNSFIRQYLEGQNLSSIESPSQITSYSRLEEFLNNRN